MIAEIFAGDFAEPTSSGVIFTVKYPAKFAGITLCSLASGLIIC